MAIAYISPVPYIILIVVCLAIVSVCFFKFPSFRIIRRKRNLLIYSVLAFIFGLIAFQAYDVSLGPALVSFSIDNGGNQFYSGQVNQLNISCSSHGIREANFYLVLKSINGSLIVDSEQNYIQLNSIEIKIPFTLKAWETETKPVKLINDKNVSSFEFYAYIDGRVTVTSSTAKVQGLWNWTTNSFELQFLPGPVA